MNKGRITNNTFHFGKNRGPKNILILHKKVGNLYGAHQQETVNGFIFIWSRKREFEREREREKETKGSKKLGFFFFGGGCVI